MKLNDRILKYIAFSFAFVVGLFTISTSKIEAANFTSVDGTTSKVEHNTNQVLHSSGAMFTNYRMRIQSNGFGGGYVVNVSFENFTYIYSPCTFSNGVLTCTKMIEIGTDGKSSTSTGYNYIFTINNDNVVATSTDSGWGTRTYRIVETFNQTDLDNSYNNGYSAGESVGYQAGLQANQDTIYQSGFNAGQNSVDITIDNQSAIDDYITNNNYHSDNEYIEHGNNQYTAGQNSVDITQDNEKVIFEYIQNNDLYEEGYKEGYNNGYLENNTIPTIYISNSQLIYVDKISGLNYGFEISLTDYINNLNGSLDLTSLYYMDFSSSVPTQTMPVSIELLTDFSVNDILEFEYYNHVDGYDDGVIYFGDCSDVNDLSICTIVTYQTLLDNNFKFSLKDINPNLNVDKIDSISLLVQYSSSVGLRGVSVITNSSLSANADTNYDIGYKVGFITGEQVGYSTGEQVGYDKGYDVGYKKASQIVSKPGNNTLSGMVGALVETPINMFIDIFNFEFLGINLVAFFFSLLTLFIVIWLIKYLK